MRAGCRRAAVLAVVLVAAVLTIPVSDATAATTLPADGTLFAGQ